MLKTAEERGVYAFGKDGDMSAYAPKAHLGSAVIDGRLYYTKVVQDALDGKVENGQNFWWGVKEGAMDLVKISDEVPQEHQRQGGASAPRSEGRYVSKSGRAPSRTTLARNCWRIGQVADMPFITSIKFYVNGIEGNVPGAEQVIGLAFDRGLASPCC